MIKEESDKIDAYLSLYVPKSLKDFFKEIAISEKRDLAFIIRRVLIKEKAEIEQRTKQDADI